MIVRKFEEQDEERWDNYVLNESINGTFMHSRRLINYHDKKKYKDASIIFCEGDDWFAVLPACEIYEENMNILYSHSGCTFGGVVVSKEHYNISDIEGVFDSFDEYVTLMEYDRVVCRATPRLYSKGNIDLIDYEYFYRGYTQYDDLNLYINCRNIPDNPFDMLSKSCRRDYRYALKNGLQFRELTYDSEIEEFYKLLEINLRKFDTKPAHSYLELLDLKHNRFNEGIRFHGVFKDELMVAGSTCFSYGKEVLHAQYLSTTPEFQKYYPLYLLDFQLIMLAKEEGFNNFAFGISTDRNGSYFNVGLATFKERFGCDYEVNRTYIKDVK